MNGDFFTEKNEPDTRSSVIDHQQREASRLFVEGPEKKPESTVTSPKLDSSCSSTIVSEKAISTAPSFTIITNEDHQQQQQLVSCSREEVPEEEQTKAKFSAEENCHSDIRDRDKMDQNANKVLQQDQQHFEKSVQGTITTPDEGIDIDHFVSQPVLVDSSSTNGNFNSFASSTDHHHNPVSYEDIDFLSKSPKTVNNVPNFIESENFGNHQKEQYQIEEKRFVGEPPIRLNSSSSVDIIKDDESEDLESRPNFNLENSCNIINGVFENSIIIDRNSQPSSDLPPPPAIMDGLTFKSEKTESPHLERADPVVELPILVTNFPNTVIDGIFDNRLILSAYGQDTGEPPKDLLSPSDDENDCRLLDLVDGKEIYTCRIMTPETDRDSEGDVLSKPESPIPILKPQSPVQIFKSESPVHVSELGNPIAAPKSESPAPISMPEGHVSKPESPFLESESPIPKLESPVPRLESPIPKPESPSLILQQQHEILAPKTESPVPSAPLLSNEGIHREDMKINGDDIDHVSRAYDESQKALFHQTDFIQDVGMSPTAAAHDHVVMDATHDHKIETTVEHHDEKIGIRIPPPSDQLIEESTMISPAQNHDVEATKSPMTSNIEMDIVDNTEKSEQRQSEHNQPPSPQTVMKEHPADIFLREQPASKPDLHIAHIPRDEPCELNPHLSEANTFQPMSSPEATVNVMEEKFVMHEFEAPEATMLEEVVGKTTMEPPENTPPEPEKLQSAFEHVEVVEANIPEPTVERPKEKIELHKVEYIAVEPVEKKTVPEPVIESAEEKTKVKVVKASAKTPEVAASKPKSTHAPKLPAAAKVDQKKKPEPSLDAAKPALDKTKNVPGVSPAAPKASSTVPKQPATTPKLAAATKGALKPAKATPEPAKLATPKAAATKPATPITPVASSGRRTQSHSPARPPPPPPAVAAQSRRDSKPKASEIFAERKKKREEEHSNKKKATTVAAPTATSNEDKAQLEKEQRRKEAEAAFQCWLQRKEQERKRARSTGRPVDSLHTKDTKDAANKRCDDSQAAFQLKQKPYAKEDHV